MQVHIVTCTNSLALHYIEVSLQRATFIGASSTTPRPSLRRVLPLYHLKEIPCSGRCLAAKQKQKRLVMFYLLCCSLLLTRSLRLLLRCASLLAKVPIGTRKTLLLLRNTMRSPLLLPSSSRLHPALPRRFCPLGNLPRP